MERFTVRVDSGCPTGRLPLTFEQRRKARQRARLSSGDEAALLLPRGPGLREGDLLASDAGRIVVVVAAQEAVSTVYSTNARVLARVAYHLGNRHVPVQLADDWLRYAADRVLDDMVRGFGLTPSRESAPFEPEAGAYAGHSGHAHPR